MTSCEIFFKKKFMNLNFLRPLSPKKFDESTLWIYEFVFRFLLEFTCAPGWPLSGHLSSNLFDWRMNQVARPPIFEPIAASPRASHSVWEARVEIFNSLRTRSPAKKHPDFFTFFSSKWPKLAKPDPAPKFKRRSTLVSPKMYVFT